MNPTQKQFEQVWTQLRAQKSSRSEYLEEVQLKGLRGIQDLRVPLPFPVTVLAGANGAGKSTVLFALACAYKVPGAGLRDYTPAAHFPGFHPKDEKQIRDQRSECSLTYSYVAANERYSMQWARGKSWSRNFFGKKGAHQPTRKLHIRTLANLANPSEVRSILQIAQKPYEAKIVSASDILFAQSVLGFRYGNINLISDGNRDLLFAERTTGQETASYSEFHMSAGERSLLRLSLELSNLDDALVLIDEVEMALHPYIQQMMMLELARLALRNRLQIVVTTHSPVILDSVPPEARVFLEREGDNVYRREPYRDIIQKALYGRSQDKLSLLCEDEIAEAFVRGILDGIGQEIDLVQNDILVGRDTGKNQFPSHLEALAKFRRLHDVVFVLDGDGRDVGPGLLARAERFGQLARVVYLPGNDSPEVWCWNLLKTDAVIWGAKFGLPGSGLQNKLEELDHLFASATDKPSNIAKAKLESLAGFISRQAVDLVRQIGREETAGKRGDIQEIVIGIKDAVASWRSGMG